MADPKRRVFVLGWDGATFDLIKPWVAQGHLPTIARLMEAGSYGFGCFSPAVSVAGVSFIHCTITFVPPRIQPPVGNCVLDRAVGFVAMRAIGKSAMVDEWPHIAKKAGNFGRNHIPQLKLPDSGRIDDIALDDRQLQ